MWNSAARVSPVQPIRRCLHAKAQNQSGCGLWDMRRGLFLAMCLTQWILIGWFSAGWIMAESENGRAAKRLKTDADNERGDVGEVSSDSPVSDFEITRILRDCSREKNIFIHGKVRVQERDKKSLTNLFTLLMLLITDLLVSRVTVLMSKRLVSIATFLVVKY